MKHQKGSIDIKEAMIHSLLMDIVEFLTDDHPIKNSSIFKRLKEIYF